MTDKYRIEIDENDDIETILLLFPPGEHSWYEVKGCREIDTTLANFNQGWQADLSKAVSAMANSGGGYLLLGAVEADQEIKLDGIGINKKIKPNGTKKWLEDTLRTITEPFISKLNVFEFAKMNGEVLENTALYIVEIEDSPIAPHQAKDNKYYIRTGTSSTPATHQIVMDILGRKKNPQIALSFVLEIHPNWLTIDYIFLNVGIISIKNLSGFIHVPESLIHESEIRNYRLLKQNGRNIGEFIISNIASPGAYPTPILSGIGFSREIKLKKSLWTYNKEGFLDLSFFWQYSIDDSALKSGANKFRELHINDLDN